MPTETQHLEQRVAALQSDLNARDQALGDAETENNERELSRRDWFEEAQRLEKENEELRSEVKRLDLMVSQADHDYEMKRNDLERQLAERDALLRDSKRYGNSSWRERVDAALSASAEPKCAHAWETGDNPVVGKVTVCTKCTESVLGSAPVERDERPGFNAWLNEVTYEENTSDGVFKVQRYQELSVRDEQITWDAWQARAALDKSTEGASHE